MSASRKSDALLESFNIAQQLELADGIGFVGLQLAQVLARGGLRTEALTVLDPAEAAFQKLGHADGVTRVASLRETIRGGHREEELDRQLEAAPSRSRMPPDAEPVDA